MGKIRIWALIVVLTSVCIAYATVFWIIRTYFPRGESIQSTAESRAVAQQKTEIILSELEASARGGSWKKFEETRTRNRPRFELLETAPDSAVRLYFFPETVEEDSTEFDFAENELGGGLKDLRRAFEYGDRKDVQEAFDRLESRVQNYELGASTEPESLSAEALRFLGTYRTLVRLPDRGGETSR